MSNKHRPIMRFLVSWSQRPSQATHVAPTHHELRFASRIRAEREYNDLVSMDGCGPIAHYNVEMRRLYPAEQAAVC